MDAHSTQTPRRPARALILAAALTLPALAAVPALASAESDAAAIAPAPEPEGQAAQAEQAGQVLGQGIASYYGHGFTGRRTASGERFDPGQFTAAHRTLPFGSKVRVTNLRSGQSVVVRINDRGPFAHGRIIDVSHAAARDLGLIGPGRGEVSLSLFEG